MTLFVPVGFASLGDLVAQGDPVAAGQSPKALKIGLLNLMPRKRTTERQFAAMFARAETDIELVLLNMATHVPKNCDQSYLEQVYRPISDGILETLDGLIITGAPIEHLDFPQVGYWREFTHILDRLRRIDLTSLFICWSAQAALFHFYGVQKQVLDAKAFGVYPQWIIEAGSPSANGLVRGLKDGFDTPVSRHSTICPLDILKHAELSLIAGSDMAGVSLVGDLSANFNYMFNHLEYETHTLHAEYQRDIECGTEIDPPANCPILNNADLEPANTWRRSAISFFNNWSNCVKKSSHDRGGGSAHTVLAA